MENNYSYQSKIVSEKELLFHVHSWKAKGFSVGFTNGCFDILHKGHISYLEEAKKHCTKLIVAINSDESVKTLKGPNRPVNNENDRAYVLSGLLAIDFITVFNAPTPLDLIKVILPDYLFKGGDYDANETNPTNPKYIVGSDLVKTNGGKVISIPFIEGYSTTGTIAKLSH